MSFYGNVFYEFERLFFKFKFLNSDNDNVEIEPADSVNGTEATERWDTLHIDAGNRWIKMASMDEGSTRKGVTIFHAAAGGDTTYEKDIISPIMLEEGENSDIQLDNNQAFEVPTVVYDNAGHIVSMDTKIYQLPDNSLTEYFEDGAEANGFQVDSSTDMSDEDYTILAPGEKVVVDCLKLTSNGIVESIDKKYFKMPASDAEKDFTDLKDRMEIVEETLEEIPETYASLQLTGSIDDLYNESGVIADDNKFTSLTAAMGDLETSKNTVTGSQMLAQSMPIADQIIKVYELASGVNQALGNRISTMDARIEELEKKIKELSER